MPKFAIVAIGLLVFVIGWVLGGITTKDPQAKIRSIVSVASEPFTAPYKGTRYMVVCVRKGSKGYDVFGIEILNAASGEERGRKEFPLGTTDHPQDAYAWPVHAFKKDGFHTGAYVYPRSKFLTP